MKDSKLKILDTTLRDGSYTINYQFTKIDTYHICKALDEIGFDYIEIGAGIGFNAAEFSKYEPAATDSEYMQAARSAVERAKIGMFFIPGIARMEDISLAGKHGLDLIRVGTDISDFYKGFRYLDECKKLGIETAANLMKSYAVNHTKFAEVANECYKAGADSVYLVDSAGGMLPEDVKKFVTETKNKNPDITIGFHGHDNLGLSIANTIEAVACGVELVDCSIRGMGRSSGNTVTEKLLFVLKRLGYVINYDFDKLFELSEKVILPMVAGKPESSLDLIYGFSQFHSSFIEVIQTFADLYDIEARDLIIEYTKIDKLNVDNAQLERIAKQLKKSKPKKSHKFKIEGRVFKKDDAHEQVEVLKSELNTLKHKFNHELIFNVSAVYEPSAGLRVSPVIHSMRQISFASAEVSNPNDLMHLIKEWGASIDHFLIDERLKSELNLGAKNILWYNDAVLFAKAIHNYIRSIHDHDQLEGKVHIIERTEIGNEFLKLQKTFKCQTVENPSEATIIVLGKQEDSLGETLKDSPNIKWVVVTRGGVLTSDLIANHTQINFIRIDLAKEIFSEVINQKGYKQIFEGNYGRISENEKSFVSGGYIGKPGEIVVNNVNNIQSYYGISRGDGTIEYYSS